MNGAHFIKKSCNPKLSPQGYETAKSGRRRFVPQKPFCSSTYVSINATCPDSCQFKGGACYVTTGFTQQINLRLDHEVNDAKHPPHPNLAEANQIIRSFPGRGRPRKAVLHELRPGGPIPQDGARGGRDLRLHVGGDALDKYGAELLAEAADSWKRRGGGAVWTFTHRWREIPRNAWGSISVLASIDHPRAAPEALRAGYAPAVVVDSFSSDRAKRHFLVDNEHADTKIIPCPNETRGVTCVECRLCLNATKLWEQRSVIAFAVHGHGKHRVSLPVL